MIVLKSGDRMITVCTVLEVRPGTGRAAGRKVTATLELQTDIHGQTKKVCLPVAFWNSSDPQKSQMASRISRPMLKGAQIMCLLAKDKAEWTCLAFCHEGIFHLKGQDGRTYYVGLGNAPKQCECRKGLLTAFPMHYKDHIQWQILVQKGKSAKNSGRVCWMADAMVKTPHKGQIFDTYRCTNICRVPGDMVPETVINIGPYQKNPVKLVDLIKKSKYQEDVKYWLQYVASDRYQAEAGKESQKEAVKAYIQSIAV